MGHLEDIYWTKTISLCVAETHTKTPATNNPRDISYSCKSMVMLYPSRTVTNWLFLHVTILQNYICNQNTGSWSSRLLLYKRWHETVTTISLQAELMWCKDAKNHQLWLWKANFRVAVYGELYNQHKCETWQFSSNQLSLLM